MMSFRAPATRFLFTVYCGLLVVGGGCAASGPARVDVGGRYLWTDLAGHGTPTVVFEAGGGDDATAWQAIAPEAQRRNGVRTMVYDRAGLGHSDPGPPRYDIEDEAAALERALDRRGIRGPVILVAHSYGGFVATLVAARDPRVVGLVLVDANLASFFDDAEVAHLLALYTPQFSELERARPALARVLVPLMRALPETARRMRAVTLPSGLPVIDIVAEKTWTNSSPEELAAARRAHAELVAASPVREAVYAKGSGHLVMRDRPDIVLDAVARMVARVRKHR